ncbi:DUF5331 domain-containing protein [Calothrix sp. UHCC 0171]|uniref:DUF5331 domain-containing protein n=1 Tax=Calothrix sp. UHCC 0171 TaxID=3110245 RepID=UPI002B20ACF9|nr:DUF5331 domain-containing protein [Calothrix sp. UHCC 0171]MEA5572821.1 DUF5331 domain-containing protein [Calothrix sp. UHCC 0171]
MAFFYSFTESLKQKWLQFFQVNRDWILLHMQVESVYTPDGGKRPPSYLILGVANALEPKLSQLMLPFSKLNPDADTLIEVLGLHFDPDMALGNSAMPQAGEDSEIEISDNTGITEDAVISNFTAAAGLEGMASISEPEVSGFAHVPVAKTEDDFGGDISFENEAAAAKMEYNALEDINTPDEENAFNEVLMDVWGEESQAKTGDVDSEMLLGEEFGTNGFEEDSEIARLFPNG